MNHRAEGETVSPRGGHVLHVNSGITVRYPSAPQLESLRAAAFRHLRALLVPLDGSTFPFTPLPPVRSLPRSSFRSLFTGVCARARAFALRDFYPSSLDSPDDLSGLERSAPARSRVRYPRVCKKNKTGEIKSYPRRCRRKFIDERGR